MRSVFADTGYWIALVSTRDNLHAKALEVSKALGQVRIVTSELVLTELLNTFAERGSRMRYLACAIIQQIRSNPQAEIVPMMSADFEKACAMYCSRIDKGWSITDCWSFQIMEAKGITEALAADRHFEQAGFRTLLL